MMGQWPQFGGGSKGWDSLHKQVAKSPRPSEAKRNMTHTGLTWEDSDKRSVNTVKL